MVLHASKDDSGTKLGYVAADNTSILDIERCPLAVQPLNDILSSRRADPSFMASLRSDQDVWFRHTSINGPLSWMDRHPPLKFLTERTVAGPLLMPPEGFFQVNTAVANDVLIHVTRIVKNKKPEMVLDLYSGAGLFAMATAQAGVPDCRGVEIDNASVQCARQNAAALNLKNLKFSSGSAEDAMRGLPTPDIRRPTMIIMDPPRRGLEKQLLQTLTGKRPNWLLYISCAPDTLARDLAKLRDAGYRVESIRLFDMFPRTMHFETVCLLSS
jgi:23S rRNA (uracil1939-C5)-methyltransferase